MIILSSRLDKGVCLTMFDVITDTSANLDTALLQKRDIRLVPFSFQSNGQDKFCLDTAGFEGGRFYDAMRRGVRVTTSQIPPQRYCDAMRPALEQGRDVLYVGMSSGVSGAFSSARMAAAALREEFPGRSIRLVDTLGASLGEGLLAVEAARLRDEGADVTAAAAHLEEMRLRMCQVFTVDDLKYLRATGRLSNAKAALAAALHIKPILKGDGRGKIVSFLRARGRARSIEALAAQYDKYVVDAPQQTVGIAHADCPQDAEALARLLRQAHPPRDIMTVVYEPVTGSHVGPGALALFFLGRSEFRTALS